MNRRVSGRPRSQPVRLSDQDLAPKRRRVKIKKKKSKLRPPPADQTRPRVKKPKVCTRSYVRGVPKKRQQDDEQEQSASDSSWDEDDSPLLLEITDATGEADLSRDTAATASGATIKVRAAEDLTSTPPYGPCRLCARPLPSRLLLHIFDPSLDLDALISSHLRLSVTRDDASKPLHICHKCAVRLEKFDQFWRVAHASDHHFSSLLKRGKRFENAPPHLYEDALLQAELGRLAESFTSVTVVPAATAQDPLEPVTPSPAANESSLSSQAKIKLIVPVRTNADKRKLSAHTESSDKNVCRPPDRTEPSENSTQEVSTSRKSSSVKESTPENSSEKVDQTHCLSTDRACENSAQKENLSQEFCLTKVKQEPEDPSEQESSEQDPGKASPCNAVVEWPSEQIKIKEEIVKDEIIIDDSFQDPLDEMYETNGDFSMVSGGDMYHSYPGTPHYYPSGANDTQSSFESSGSPYTGGGDDSRHMGADGDMSASSYHLLPRKRGRPKGSKNKNMTPQTPGSGGRSKVFINDQYEVNFLHECRQCGSQFSDILKHSLETHMSLECPCCAETFIDRPTLVEHFQSVHNTKSQVIYFPCPLCPEKLRTEEDLHTHVNIHADSLMAPYECFSCDFSDSDFMEMAKHIVESHCELTEDHRYECPICEDQETMASSFDELCNHLYDTHIPEEKVNLISCPVCNVRLGNDTVAIRTHLLDHTTRQIFIRPKYYRCPACNAGFKSQINLVKHACPNIVNNRCEECDINFPSKMRHTFHLQHHLEEPMQLKCDICFTDFDDESSLYDHVRFIHVQDNQLKCGICNKENFKNHLSLSIHMRYHENVREYECETCGKKFINKSTLKEHSVSHMRVKPFKCEICGHYLSRASRLRAHLKAHSVVASNNKVQSCKKCYKCCQVFPSNEENLRKHFEKVHFDTEFDASHFYDIVLKCVYRCEFCDSCFNETYELNRHRAVNHPDPESPTAFSCLTCGVAFPAYSRLTTHKLTHGINTESLILTDEDEKNDRFRIVQYFLCELCDKTSIHYTYLCLHKKLKHSNLTYGGQTPVCDPCNLTFKNEWQFLVHNRTVHEVQIPPKPEPNPGPGPSESQCNTPLSCRKAKPNPNHVKSVTCEVCDKAFTTKESCRAHFLRQHGVKPATILAVGSTPCAQELVKFPFPRPFACEICEKTYTVEHSLLSHYDMHSGNNYQCDICFKEFRSSITLRNHARRHDNFACDECSVVCQDLNALRCHTLREHGQSILSCEKCDKKFTTKNMLAEHIATKHNEDPTLKCVLCNTEVLFAELEQHQEQHKVFIVRCDSCTTNFESMDAISDHLEFKHSNQFLMKCFGCNLLIAQTDILTHLSLIHSPDTPPSQFECNQCKEKSTSVPVMLTHYDTKHCIDVNMSCVPCEVQFHNRGSLYKHLYLEHKTDGLAIQCNMCSLTLTSKESTMAHFKAAHMSLVSCKTCSAQFPNTAALNKHMKIEHSGKAYQCNECPEKFERLNKLKRHMFSQHNDSLHQIQCPYCITDFSEDRNLIQHIVSVHLGKEKQDAKLS